MPALSLLGCDAFSGWEPVAVRTSATNVPGAQWFLAGTVAEFGMIKSDPDFVFGY